MAGEYTVARESIERAINLANDTPAMSADVMANALLSSRATGRPVAMYWPYSTSC